MTNLELIRSISHDFAACSMLFAVQNAIISTCVKTSQSGRYSGIKLTESM